MNKLDKQTNWGGLQAWTPGAKPREVSWPEDEQPGQFAGTVINMREVTNANIRDGVIARNEQRKKEKAELLERPTLLASSVSVRSEWLRPNAASMSKALETASMKYLS